MKKLLPVILLFCSFISPVFATEYTMADVTKHNTETDCYAILDNNVYDFTPFIAKHDKFMDIRPWCGKDMSADFKDKDGRDRDHKATTYELIKTYKIGTLSNSIPTASTSKQPYNFWVPFILAIVMFFVTWIASKLTKASKLITFHKLIWNILQLFLLIPVALFGIFMVIRYSAPDLNKINFDFLYWHVEFSIYFSVIVILHVIERLPHIFMQIKIVFKKAVPNPSTSNTDTGHIQQ